MKSHYRLTRHAHERSMARSIPPLIAEIIMEYGESREAGEGARKYALTKESMRQLRRVAGRAIANVVAAYRARNVYVVEAEGRIITVAFSSKPIFS